MEKKPKKWVQAMKMKKGALHKDLNVPMGQKIPAKKLAKAAKSSNPTLVRRVNLARTLSGLRK